MAYTHTKSLSHVWINVMIHWEWTECLVVTRWRKIFIHKYKSFKSLCPTEPSPVRGLKEKYWESTSTLSLSWLVPAVPKGPLKVYEIEYGRLRLSPPHLQYLDRDDVCSDKNKKDEPREYRLGQNLIVGPLDLQSLL